MTVGVCPASKPESDGSDSTQFQEPRFKSVGNEGNCSEFTMFYCIPICVQRMEISGVRCNQDSAETPDADLALWPPRRLYPPLLSVDHHLLRFCKICLCLTFYAAEFRTLVNLSKSYDYPLDTPTGPAGFASSPTLNTGCPSPLLCGFTVNLAGIRICVTTRCIVFGIARTVTLE